MKKYKDSDYQIIAEWVENENFHPYSYPQFEQAFWHLWTLNCYHLSGTFDVNMVLLLDWALVFHLGNKK